MLNKHDNIYFDGKTKNIYDVPSEMYKYKGVYNKKRRSYFEQPNIAYKGLANIKKMGSKIMKRNIKRYPGTPVDEVEPGNGNKDKFATAKEILEELEDKEKFYGGKENRLNSERYISE